MSLTATQLALFRRKIDDTSATPAYSDDELNATFEEAEGNLDRAVLLIIEELMMRGSKYTDYVQNQSSEKRHQVFESLKAMHDLYEKKLSKASGQFKMVGVRSVPPNRKETPDGECAEWET